MTGRQADWRVACWHVSNPSRITCRRHACAHHPSRHAPCHASRLPPACPRRPSLIPCSLCSKLFREYAVADLSRYKEGKVGLRWRTQQEVVNGAGQFECGAKVGGL